jgi:hypothetical protein
MTMPNDQNRRSGFLQSATGQVTVFVLAIIIVLILAWRYVF